MNNKAYNKISYRNREIHKTVKNIENIIGQNLNNISYDKNKIKQQAFNELKNSNLSSKELGEIHNDIKSRDDSFFTQSDVFDNAVEDIKKDLLTKTKFFTNRKAYEDGEVENTIDNKASGVFKGFTSIGGGVFVNFKNKDQDEIIFYVPHLTDYLKEKYNNNIWKLGEKVLSIAFSYRYKPGAKDYDALDKKQLPVQFKVYKNRGKIILGSISTLYANNIYKLIKVVPPKNKTFIQNSNIGKYIYFVVEKQNINTSNEDKKIYSKRGKIKDYILSNLSQDGKNLLRILFDTNKYLIKLNGAFFKKNGVGTKDIKTIIDKLFSQDFAKNQDGYYTSLKEVYKKEINDRYKILFDNGVITKSTYTNSNLKRELENLTNDYINNNKILGSNKRISNNNLIEEYIFNY